MGFWECEACGHIFTEKENVSFDDHPANWICPDCGATKDKFSKKDKDKKDSD